MRNPAPDASDGAISSGIEPHTLVFRTIRFVEHQLPLWRDDPTRVGAESEEELNSQLCKFLNDRARSEFPMVFFHHEERQGMRRRVDLCALPTREAVAAATYLAAIYNPFLVLEGKRLPAPTAARQREYITGFNDRSGAIQRFRLCLHGAEHNIAVIIGYVQANDAPSWHNALNGWIMDLATSDEDTTCGWNVADGLQPLVQDSPSGMSRCESNHARIGRPGIGVIRLIHLWVRMRSNSRGRNSIP